MKTSITLIALLATLSLCGTAMAKPVRYAGKTKAGTKITFRLSGHKLSRIRTYVPTLCVSSRSRTTRAGAETFEPSARLTFALGRTTKRKASKQTSAMAPGHKTTKTYTVASQRGKAGKIAGKLRVSFSWFVPDLFNNWTIMLCSGSTRFTAHR